jgi:DNA-binding transcriptional MerR regulator
MGDEAEFIEFMEIQGSTELVSKTELLAAVRDRHLPVSERTLTYYITKGIIPKAARIGTRTGVYPRIVIELLSLALLNRQRGASIEATRQLVPLWKLIARGAITGELDLAEIEYVARQHVTLADANFAVPFMMKEILSYLPARDQETIVWRLKDGESFLQSRDDSFEVTFLLGAESEDGMTRIMAWSQLRLPGFGQDLDPNDPRTVVLGVPVGVDVEPLLRAEAKIEAAPPTAPAAYSGQEDSN